MTRRFLAALLIIAITALSLGVAVRSSAGPVSADGDSTASTGGNVRVFVTFADDFDRDGSRSDESQEQRDENVLVHSLGGSVRQRYDITNAVAVEVSATNLDDLASAPGVISVQPDGVVRATDAELDSSWGVKRIGAGPVHDSGQKGAGVKVGIIDTGINLTHVDLDANYSASCSDDFVNDIYDLNGNLILDDTDPTDDHGHGSHVSGIVAGEDNNTGVVGVAPLATLCAYKVLAANGSGSWSGVIAALDRAIADGVSVVNLSLGAPDYPGSAVEEAFTRAYGAGVVIVAAAGNSGTCAGSGDSVQYPARFSTVIAVGATDSTDIAPCFSSTGPKVEVAAPGVSVLSAWMGSNTTYVGASGTSMASPHTAGLAALIRGCKPSLTNVQVRSIIDSTARDLDNPLAAGFPDGRDTWYGFGLIQAQAAITAAGPCTSGATPAPSATSTRTATATATRTSTATPPPPTATGTATNTPASAAPSATATRTPTQTATPVAPTATSTRTPTRTATATATNTPATGGSLVCTAPVISSHADTIPGGGGMVSFSWNAVPGATRYVVQRRATGWNTIGATTATSFIGSDGVYDPDWRVYVSLGTCSPLPGPATVFNP